MIDIGRPPPTRMQPRTRVCMHAYIYIYIYMLRGTSTDTEKQMKASETGMTKRSKWWRNGGEVKSTHIQTLRDSKETRTSPQDFGDGASTEKTNQTK